MTCDLIEAFESCYVANRIKSQRYMQPGSDKSYGFDINFKNEFVATTERILGSKQMRPQKKKKKKMGTPNRRGFGGIQMKST